EDTFRQLVLGKKAKPMRWEDLTRKAAEPPAPAGPAKPAAQSPPAVKSPSTGTWGPLGVGRFTQLPLEKWSITETSVTTDILGGEHKFAYKLDLKSAPAGIDLTPLDGPDKGKTYPGIFTRDGDFLEVCYDSRPGAKRPKVFVSHSDLGGSRSLAFVKAEQL